MPSCQIDHLRVEKSVNYQDVMSIVGNDQDAQSRATMVLRSITRCWGRPSETEGVSSLRHDNVHNKRRCREQPRQLCFQIIPAHIPAMETTASQQQDAYQQKRRGMLTAYHAPNAINIQRRCGSPRAGETHRFRPTPPRLRAKIGPTWMSILTRSFRFPVHYRYHWNLVGNILKSTSSLASRDTYPA